MSTKPVLDWTYVYVVSALHEERFVKPCKIGISKNFKSRVASIATSSPTPVQCVMAIPLPKRSLAEVIEKAAHEIFAKYRLNGEWFDLCPYQAGIGICTLIKEMYEALGFSEDQALDLARHAGVTNALEVMLSQFGGKAIDGVSGTIQ